MENRFIGNIRSALAGSADKTELRSLEMEVPVFANPGERFRAELEAVNGRCFMERSSDSLKNSLITYIRELGINTLVFYDNDILKTESLLEESAFPEGVKIFPGKPGRDTALRGDAGITGAYKLIAESGSIVMLSGTPGGRFGSLLPRHHIVLASDKQIISTFHETGEDEIFRDAPWSVLISGPSRTADIEQKIILGVHGPLTLAVFILCG